MYPRGVSQARQSPRLLLTESSGVAHLGEVRGIRLDLKNAHGVLTKCDFGSVSDALDKCSCAETTTAAHRNEAVAA